jgi:hypothetical protein
VIGAASRGRGRASGELGLGLLVHEAAGWRWSSAVTGHGATGAVPARPWQTEGEGRRGSEGMREWKGGLPIATRRGRCREQGGGGSNGELELLHGRHVQNTRHPLKHFVGHLAGSKVGKVGAVLGQLRAESGHGPKMKFAAHMKTYNFYLRCTTIRVMD